MPRKLAVKRWWPVLAIRSLYIVHLSPWLTINLICFKCFPCRASFPVLIKGIRRRNTMAIKLYVTVPSIQDGNIIGALIVQLHTSGRNDSQTWLKYRFDKTTQSYNVTRKNLILIHWEAFIRAQQDERAPWQRAVCSIKAISSHTAKLTLFYHLSDDKRTLKSIPRSPRKCKDRFFKRKQVLGSGRLTLPDSRRQTSLYSGLWVQ